MRIIAEWYAASGRDSTCLMYYREAFEGETVEEINAAIKARAGDAKVLISGLRNTRENFEIYSGQPTEPYHRFADDFPVEASAPESWFARLAQRVLRRLGL